MGYNNKIDYTDVSYIPDDGLLFVDTSALEFVGYFEFVDYKVEKIKIARARNCLRRFKSRSGKVVASKGVLGEVEEIVNHYKRRKIGAKNAISRDRISKRSFKGGNKIRFTPCFFNTILQENKTSLKFYRSLYEFLATETERNFSKVSESKLVDIQAYLYSSDISKNLSLVDKGLLVNLISSGDKCGLFSADLPMIGAYYDAVKRFSLADCFVCDGVYSRTNWLK